MCILRRRVTAAGFLINLAGALSLAVYMLVVYPASDAAGILSDLWVGFGAVTLYNTVAGLSAYRTASPGSTASARGGRAEARRRTTSAGPCSRCPRATRA